MRIWRCNEHGPVDSMTLEDRPIPEPAEGEALVRLRYAALNPADRFLVMGMYPKGGNPPITVGRDGAGVVESSRGSHYKPGDEVIVLRSAIGVTRDGTLAEYVTVPEASLAPLPAGWTMQEGASGPLVYLTAWRALVQLGEIRPDHTVLVTGASGGVGIAAVHLAKAFGARVVAISRSEEKRNRLKEIGADIVADSSNADTCESEIKAALDGGCDLVVENLGGPFLQMSVNLCNPHGRILVIGLLAGLTSEIVLGRLIAEQVRIEGCAVAALTPPETQDAWIHIVDKLDANQRRPLIDSVYPLEKVPEAFGDMAAGSLGKVLIDVTA